MPELGQIAVNFFQDRFRAQAWTDRSAKKWAKRKNPDKRNRKKNRAILIKSGRLRNSIHVKSSSLHDVVISTPVKYAAVHNFGFRGVQYIRPHHRKVNGRVLQSNIKTRRTSTRKVQVGRVQVKGHARRVNIPQRQFMGNSFVLSRKFDKAIFRRLDKISEQ
jgi:phage gpG-like protein